DVKEHHMKVTLHFKRTKKDAKGDDSEHTHTHLRVVCARSILKVARKVAHWALEMVKAGQ
ncbi:hypothetical protein MTO96_033736, partial [Rhipicephalus appendiculatus]